MPYSGTSLGAARPGAEDAEKVTSLVILKGSVHLGSHGRGLAGQKRVPLYGTSFGTADASVGEPVCHNLGQLSGGILGLQGGASRLRFGTRVGALPRRVLAHTSRRDPMTVPPHPLQKLMRVVTPCVLLGRPPQLRDVSVKPYRAPRGHSL